MAKQREEKTNVMRILEQRGIPYIPHTYEHDEGVAVDGVTVAESLGQDPECVFKTLVVRGSDASALREITDDKSGCLWQPLLL